MTTNQIEEYRKTAKKGDRFHYYTSVGLKTATTYYVLDVKDRGVVFSIREKTPDHMCLMEWNWLDKYVLIHKEA